MTSKQWVRQADAKRAAEVGERLKWARERNFGIRGRATLARALGLSPSTYNYYEGRRVPPPDILARAAELTGVHLEWLISGQGPRERKASQVAADPKLMAALDPQLQVALGRLVDKGGNAAVAQALAEVLQAVQQRFPASIPVESESRVVDDPEQMVPIIGRTAAGLVADYRSLLGDEPSTTVAQVAAKALGLSVTGYPAQQLEADDPQMGVEAPPMDEVALVQLDEPLESGVAEFVHLPGFRRRWRGAFAMRVDGESMMPRYRHGDVVVAAARHPVRVGQAALVQVSGRVGVTLKLIRREGQQVHLVPINETYETETLPAEAIEWTAPVLFALRF